MALRLNGSAVDCVFRLNGFDENSATFALGWTLTQSPALLSVFLQAYGIDPKFLKEDNLEIDLQRHDEDKGFTDIEIRIPDHVHLIIEAKRGWQLPSNAQLARYVTRFERSRTATNLLITLSAASEIWGRRLPATVGAFNLNHISWTTLVGMINLAHGQSARMFEKLWLRELRCHLENYMVARDVNDNRVYVVSLSRAPIREGNPYTWIDVVEKDKTYFHPVGTSGWPPIPPNYIGFRYAGHLQSVHHIDRFDVVDSLISRDGRWPEVDQSHFVYSLGPPMKPPKPVRTGNLFRAARCWCAIDTLLAGSFDTISDAAEETRLRNKNAQA